MLLKTMVSPRRFERPTPSLAVRLRMKTQVIEFNTIIEAGGACRAFTLSYQLLVVQRKPNRPDL